MCLSGGDGASIVIDTTGVPSLIQQATDFTANCGKMVLLGVAPGDAVQGIPLVPFMVVCYAFKTSLNPSANCSRRF